MRGDFCAPFFEIGPKAYLHGAPLIDLALAAEEASVTYNVPVIFTVPPTEIAAVSRAAKRLLVFAQHMDSAEPGRGMGLVLPEQIRQAGARGVMLNHCEQPLSLSELKRCIDRADETGLYTIVCADTVEEAAAIAHLSPDIIVAEPAANIGSGRVCDPAYIEAAMKAVRGVNPDIKVLLAAGISTPEDVYHMVISGADASGSTSGVLKAENPAAMAREMIAAVRRAWDDRRAGEISQYRAIG